MPKGRPWIVIAAAIVFSTAGSVHADPRQTQPQPPVQSVATPQRALPPVMVAPQPEQPHYRVARSNTATPAPTPSTPAQPTTPTPETHHHDHDADHDRFHHDRRIDLPYSTVIFTDTGGYDPSPSTPVDDRPPVPPMLPPGPVAQLPQQPPFDPVAAAQRVLDAVTAQLHLQFEASPIYLDAQSNVRAASAALAEATARARVSLKYDPQYRAALESRDSAARAVTIAQLESRHATLSTQPTTQPAPIPGDLFRAAQAKLAATTHVTDVEAKLMSTDSAVATATDRLAAAQQHLSQITTAFAATMQDDPAWIAAKKRLDAARTASAMGP